MTSIKIKEIFYCENFARQFAVFCFVLLAPMFSLLCESQMDTAIVRTFGGPYFEEGKQMIESAAGGYAIIGTTGSYQYNNTDFYLIRLDADLNCMWSKAYGGLDVEWGQSIVEDNDGNFLMCGYTNSQGAGGYDVMVIKVDAAGEIIWEKKFGGVDWDFGYKIIEHPQSGFLICGKTYSYGNGGSDAYLLHIEDDGNLLNEWTYGGVGEDGFTSMLFLSDTQLIIGGFTQIAIDQHYAWVISIGDDYIIQWQKLYDQFENSTITDMKLSNDGYFLLSGNYIYEGAANNGFYEKLNDLGISSFIQSSNEYSVESIVEGPEFLYVVGNTTLFGSGGSAAIILRLDLYSSWLNGAAFGGVFDEKAHDLIIDNQGSVLLLGASSSYSSNVSSDAYVVKFIDPVIVSNYALDVSGENCFTVGNETDEKLEKMLVIQDQLSISLNWVSGKYNVVLYDMNGACAIRNHMYTNNQRISTENLAMGIYVMHITDGVQFLSRRISITH